jgi:hypothetical protein
MQKEVPVMSTLRNQIIQSLEGLSDDSLLQFLDVVSQGEKYSELSDPETGIFLKNYAKQQNYSRELLSSVLSGITGPTAKKLIKWGIIYEFTS